MKIASFYKQDALLRSAASFHSPSRTAPSWLRVVCVAGLVLLAFPALAQVDIFMSIGGQAAPMGTNPQLKPKLLGSSADQQYANWIPILSMSHGISLPVTTGSTGTVVGKSQHADVSVSMLMDQSATALNLLVNGSSSGLSVTLPIDYVTIDFRTPAGGNGPTVFYRMELQGVYITSVSVSAGGDTPYESVTLNYQRIRWYYNSPATGKSSQSGWDLSKNGPY